MSKQLVMNLATVRAAGWGGPRPGAGRKPYKGRRRGVPHRARPHLTRHQPAIVTLKLRPELRSLRKKDSVKVIRRAFVATCDLPGCRIIDWSVQDSHLHLTLEADNRVALSRAMQAFCVRVAKGMHALRGTSGPVFADRYHVRVLRTPREVRNARAYVLLNYRRHEGQQGRVLPAAWLDPFSSAAWFDGWCDGAGLAAAMRAGGDGEGSPPVGVARSWLMRVGWRRHGLVRVAEVPGH